MSFAEEVAEERRPEGQPPKFLRWVDSQPDALEIWEALSDPTVSTGQIYRALKKRGFTGHESTVARHARALRQ